MIAGYLSHLFLQQIMCGSVEARALPLSQLPNTLVCPQERLGKASSLGQRGLRDREQPCVMLSSFDSWTGSLSGT